MKVTCKDCPFNNIDDEVKLINGDPCDNCDGTMDVMNPHEAAEYHKMIDEDRKQQDEYVDEQIAKLEGRK